MKHVCGIMPTRGRSEWAMQAVECFLAQTYENKSLLILDDEDDRSFPDGLPREPRFEPVSYTVSKRHTIGKKRNLACEMANHAKFIAHFDSDDWSAPSRLAQQVALLEMSGKALTGFDSLIFYEPRTGRAGRWADAGNCCGTSMVYRRDWWKTHPFPEVTRSVTGAIQAWGEDNAFRNMATDEKQLIAVRGDGLIVARAHAGNTNAKKMGGFMPFPTHNLPEGFPR